MASSSAGPIRRADDPDSLTIDGLVTTPITLERPMGALAPILDAAAPEGDHATVHSGDGLFQASIPVEIVRGASLGADGRLAIDDPPTRCWLVKDVRRIEVTEGRRPDSLPAEERAKT